MGKKIPKAFSEPRVRRFPAWLIFVFCAVILPMLAALLALRCFPWTRLKNEAAAAGSRALGRELSIGSVDVGLFSGLRVQDITIANAPGFGAQPLFSAPEARVDVSLLPLLAGKVLINSVTFVQPQFLFETNAQGVSNLQGLGAAPDPSLSPKEDASASSSHGPPPVLGASSSPDPDASPNINTNVNMNVLLAALVIQDGTVTMRKLRQGTESDIQGLNGRLTGFSLAAGGVSRLEMEMSAQVQGKQIPLSLLSDFELDLADQRLQIISLDLKAPALGLTLTGTVEHFSKPVADLRLTAEMDLKKLPELLPPSGNSLFAQWQGKLEGILSVQAHVKVERSSQPLVLDRTWIGAGFEIKDGVVHRTMMQNRLADAVPYPAIQGLLRSDITFSTARGQLVYGARRVKLRDFVLGSGADFRGGPECIEASGTMAQDQGLDFKIILHFNPSLGFPKGDVTKAFEDDKGWPTFDYIEYSGSTFNTAKADFTQGIQKAASNALQRLLQNLPGSWSKYLGN